MSIKTLLVIIDELKSCAERTKIALSLARQFDAHLAALALVDDGLYRGTMASVEIPPAVIEAWERQRDETLARIAATFETAAGKAGIAAETRKGDATGYSVPAMGTIHARYADLTIVGQADPDRDAAGRIDLPERIVMESGRPILLVPDSGSFETVGKHVLVAWNASRESMRAVHDAMPFLRRAERITVLSVNPRGGVDFAHGALPGADVATMLARHGLEVNVETLKGEDGGAGDLLLSRGFELGADMLVMGAYGHSRFREMVLGGVTRTILRSATMPVLLSH